MDQESAEDRRASDGQCRFSPIQAREERANELCQPQFEDTNMLISDRSHSFLYKDHLAQPAQASDMIWAPPVFDVLAPASSGMDYAMTSAFGNRPDDESLLKLEQSRSATETLLSMNAAMREETIFRENWLANRQDLIAYPLMPIFAELSPEFNTESLYLAPKQIGYSSPNTISDSIGHTNQTIDNEYHKFVGLGVGGSASHGMLTPSTNYWLDSKTPDSCRGPLASPYEATDGSV